MTLEKNNYIPNKFIVLSNFSTPHRHEVVCAADVTSCSWCHDKKPWVPNLSVFAKHGLRAPKTARRSPKKNHLSPRHQHWFESSKKPMMSMQSLQTHKLHETNGKSSSESACSDRMYVGMYIHMYTYMYMIMYYVFCIMCYALLCSMMYMYMYNV